MFNLLIEAVAEDGLVKAFSVVSARTFALAVQWHPGGKVEEKKGVIVKRKKITGLEV